MYIDVYNVLRKKKNIFLTILFLFRHTRSAFEVNFRERFHTSFFFLYSCTKAVDRCREELIFTKTPLTMALTWRDDPLTTR